MFPTIGVLITHVWAGKKNLLSIFSAIFIFPTIGVMITHVWAGKKNLLRRMKINESLENGQIIGMVMRRRREIISVLQSTQSHSSPPPHTMIM